ncbi:MAG TPA: pseudouridine-5'-phosphate glycosidase [Pyrinomonadaceae bacterium]|jgi:pseudouridine-5'-phosphate glycosidase|nr:pseudouridine-5'-phosphate glycosidase [Pyrinomonadaceae bacterium]
MSDAGPFTFSGEVAAALASRRPVVALESTVIAHGLPRPQNLETARRLESIVREEGATPATIAVIGGEVFVGLEPAQLEHIADSQTVHKLSTRDLPVAVARGWDGATTVASTAFVAARAGLSVFATGGIGGVHRGELPDVSADLPELARTSLAVVVCSGAKSVLDLPATREWLETYGVTVVGYGCDEMPAFYTRSSGLAVDVRCDSPEEVCRVARARREMRMPGALVVTVPVPVEDQVMGYVFEGALEKALAEAAEAGVSGRELTPFLLRRIAGHSGGATLRANLSLLESNARVAARIARALPAEEEGER